MSERIAIFCGAGELPIITANELEKQKKDFLLFLVEGISDFPEGLYDDRKRTVSLARIGKFLKELRKEKITHIIFIGRIPKKIVFHLQKYDLKTISLLFKLINKHDRNIFNIAIKEMEKLGIEVLPQSKYLTSIMAIKGCYTKKKPSKKDWEDIYIGFRYAKEIAKLGIGQTVIVKDGVAISVEAIEGTNEAIKRAGNLISNGGLVVCKVQAPNHDERFDIPTVGIPTIQAMVEAKAKILAIESNKTFIINKEQMIHLANEKGIIIVGV
jgi:DUF1009 family protein